MPTISAICPLPLIPVMYMDVPPNLQAFVSTSLYMAPARERERERERAREIRQTILLSNLTYQRLCASAHCRWRLHHSTFDVLTYSYIYIYIYLLFFVYAPA